MRSTNTVALVSYNFHTSDSIVPEMDCKNSGWVNLDHLENLFLTELLYKIFWTYVYLSIKYIDFHRGIEHKEEKIFCCYLKC